MSKIRLVFTRMECDNVSSGWTGVKTLDIDIAISPESGNWHGKWQLVGGEWLDDKEREQNE